MAKLLAGVKPGFDLTPAGWWQARVAQGGVKFAAVKQGENKGQPRVNVQLNITAEGRQEGKAAFMGLNLYGKSLGIARRDLETITGNKSIWDDFDFPVRAEDTEQIRALAEVLEFCECYILIEHREYLGEMQSSIKRLLPSTADMEGRLASDIAES